MNTEPYGENQSRVNRFVLTLGVVLLLVGGLRLYRCYGNSDLVPVEATIERVERVSRRNRDVYVTCQYDGVTCSDMKLDYYHGGMQMGDTVTLGIYPANPRNYETPSGGLTALVGIGAGVKAFLRRKKQVFPPDSLSTNHPGEKTIPTEYPSRKEERRQHHETDFLYSPYPGAQMAGSGGCAGFPSAGTVAVLPGSRQQWPGNCGGHHPANRHHQQ